MIDFMVEVLSNEFPFDQKIDGVLEICTCDECNHAVDIINQVWF